MSWTEGSRRWLARVDVRVALALFWMYAPAISLVLLVQLGYEARELLEVVTQNARGRLAELARELEEPQTPERPAQLEQIGAVLARADLGYRLSSAAGETVDARGLALDPERSRAPRGLLRDALSLGSHDQLLFDRALSGGRMLTLVVAMRRFSIERGELLRATGISFAVGIGLAMAISAVAMRRALRPLREATLATSRIELERLDARLPVRGTGDDVDRHAAALNRVLDRLEAGFQRIQEFNHDVAHELRTPINRILNAAEVSLLSDRGDTGTRHALQVIRDSAEGMGQVVDALLLLAREGESSFDRRAVPLETGPLFETIEKAYAPVFDERGVRLEVGRGAGAVRGDATLLLRALSNLLDNALRHTPAGGSVRLDAEREPASICLRVSDSGPGVAEADRARIFRRFVRLDREGPPGGAGLGLPIASMIARVHGGALSVEASSLGGACFALRLPAAQVAAPPGRFTSG